ncbi:hypothetical protein GPALN_013221 [Globodera pallida]|uniref:BTB/POZ domain-containing protein n=1 Tax=Globodera pallida TaxID=36090 RepID=A0A183CBR8_GLOPA|nr:hypothetical protein GPALN_013221 [Globodera pallida]
MDAKKEMARKCMQSVGLVRYLVEQVPVDWNGIVISMRLVEAKRFKDALLVQIDDCSFESVDGLKTSVGLGQFEYSAAELLTMCVEIVRLCGIWGNSTVEDLLSLLKFLSHFGKQVSKTYQIN